MHIGIYINHCNLHAGMFDQDEEVVPVGGNSLAAEHSLAATPLKIYVEDNFAYLGLSVDTLIANDYGLNCAKYFLDGLYHPQKTIYTDPTGIPWSAPGLLAIFLKKLKGDVSIQNAGEIQGALITSTLAVTAELIEGLELAFELAGIPFLGAVNLDRAVWKVYGADDISTGSQNILIYNLERRALTLDLFSVEGHHFKDTIQMQSEMGLGEKFLQGMIIEFLTKTYQQMTGKKIKKSAKNAMALSKMAQEVLSRYFSQSNLYIRTVYNSTDPIVELILTRAQIEVIISRYMQRSISFLKEFLQTAGLIPDDIGEIILTGESTLLPLVPAALQSVFNPEKTGIYGHNPAEMIPKGITQLANDAIQRDTSGNVSSNTGEKAKNYLENGTESLKFRVNQDTSQLFQLIHSMQINRIGDM